MAGFTIPDQEGPPPQQPQPPAVETLGETVGDPEQAPSATPAPPPEAGSDAPRRHEAPAAYNAGGPFAMPRRDYVGDADVHMEDVSGDDKEGSPKKSEEVSPSKRVQTMPTLPSPPIFRGSTAQDKQVFMKKYEAYCRQLSALEAAFFRPFRMPVGACVEAEHRRLVAMFDICKPLDEITETDWINYFWEGRIAGELDFDKVKAIMSTNLSMDIQLADVDSRVLKLAHEMYQVLEKENMAWIIEKEPKKIVSYLTDALAPKQFRRTVKNEMAWESNKPLTKDVVAFMKWLRISYKKYVRWEPRANQRVQSTGKQTTKKSDQPPGSSYMARVENVLDLANVLLDSGADINITSRGLVNELVSRGVELREDACAPRKLATFDGSLFEVTRRIVFDTIQIRTTAGPLLLRNTPAWIFEQEQEKHTLVLSRPVMERLGYSVNAILAKACDTQQKWDLQDLSGGGDGDAICLIRDNSLLQAQHRAARPEDAEWRTATPELGTGGENVDAQVTAILLDRIVEAMNAGLGPSEVESLTALLHEYRDVFRLTFGGDPPVRVEPLRVRLREGATPVRINASPPRIVAKSEPGTYRMTVDTRAVNERTEPIQWPMPILEAALGL